MQKLFVLDFLQNDQIERVEQCPRKQTRLEGEVERGRENGGEDEKWTTSEERRLFEPPMGVLVCLRFPPRHWVISGIGGT